jgi:hypothetical protein
LFNFSASPCLIRRGNSMPALASKLVLHYSLLMHRPVVFKYMLSLATCSHPFWLRNPSLSLHT